MKTILNVTRNLLLYEWKEKRVIMGFLVGMAMPLWWLKNFLDYVAGTGEPVNILEAFVVIEHEGGSMVFLALGWLLIMADAPFVNEITHYSLYRTKKRSWNSAMVLYISIQAAFYTFAAALPAVLISFPYGFAGKMWSNPVYMLSKDLGMGISENYMVVFSRQDMMRHLNVPQAFGATILCFFFYLVAIGVILYTLSLLAGGVWGVVVTFLVHIMPYRGFARFALIGYSRPGNFADYSGMHLMEPVGTMLLIVGAFVILENLLIGRVDFAVFAAYSRRKPGKEV